CRRAQCREVRASAASRAGAAKSRPARDLRAARYSVQRRRPDAIPRPAACILCRVEGETWRQMLEPAGSRGRKARLVLRFRSSHHIATYSHANFGIIRSTSKFMILVRFYGFEVPTELAASSDGNFKSTALVAGARDATTHLGLA